MRSAPRAAREPKFAQDRPESNPAALLVRTCQLLAWRKGALRQRAVLTAAALTSHSRRVLGMPGSHPGVDAYIAGLPAWQQEVCRQLRQIIRKADPDIEETLKRSVQPYFVLNGNVCALLATKDHINLFLYDPTVSDPEGIINQGHGNATARAIQIFEGDPVNRSALSDLIKAIAANNRAGGWRRLSEPGARQGSSH